MEAMLWLMIRLGVHCSSGDFETPSGVTGSGCVAVVAIFGFVLVRFAASQG
jgi:hypothetical protein